MSPTSPESLHSLNRELTDLLHRGRYRQALQRAATANDRTGEDADRAVFFHLVANSHRELAEFSAAEEHYLRALPALAATVGKLDPAYARALDDLGHLYVLVGRYEQAEPLFRSALKTHEACPTADEFGRARCLRHLADLLDRRDHRREGLRVLAQGQAVVQRVGGAGHPDYARCLLVEAWLSCRMGGTTDALRHARRALDVLREALGDSHPDAATASYRLGRLLLSAGRPLEAEPYLAQALEVRRETLGAGHPETAVALEAMAYLRAEQGREKEAETLARQAVEAVRAAVGERHPDYAHALATLGFVLHWAARLAEAEEIQTRVVEIYKGVHGERHPQVAEALLHVAGVRWGLGRPPDAEETMREALTLLDGAEADTEFERVVIEVALVDVLCQRGLPREAETLAAGTLERARLLAPNDPVVLVPALTHLAQARGALGKAGESRELLLEAERLAGTLPDLHGVKLDLAYRLAEQDHFEGNLDGMTRRAREAVRQARALGETHPRHAQALAYLAYAVAQKGEFEEAERLYTQALNMTRRTSGGERPERTRILRQLAQLYLGRGNLNAAEARFREALDVRKAAFGDRHPDVAESLDDLAGLQQQGGNLLGAESLYRQALDVRRETPGDDSPEFALTLHRLGVVLHQMGRLPEAEEHLNQGLDVLRSGADDEHADCLRLRHSLALVAWDRGDLSRAEELLNQVLHGAEALAGPAHPSVVPSLMDLARLHDSLGDRAAALECLQRVEMVNVGVHGRDSLPHALDLVNQSNILSSLGEADRALAMAREALAIARRKLEDGDPGLLAYRSQVGAMCQAARQFDEAEAIYQAVLNDVKEAAGNRHPEVGRGMMRLAGLCSVVGRKEEAGRHYEKACDVLRAGLGEDHPEHAAARQTLARHYHDQGQYVRAEEAFERHLAITRRTFGAQHPNVAFALQMQAEMEWQRGEHESAESHFREALELVRQAEVPLDGTHAALLHGLGLVLRARGKNREAEEPLRAALDLDESSVGEETPGHMAALHDLAGVCAATGREAEAVRLWSRVLHAHDRLSPAYSCMEAVALHEAFLKQTWSIVENVLTVAARHPDVATTAALDAVLRWKGATTGRLGEDKEALLQRHPPLRKRLERRFYLGRQTATRGWFGAGGEGMDTHKKLLGRWREERERIEEELSDQVPEFAALRRRRAMTVEAVAAQLPEGGVLVEYVRFVPKTFEVRSDGTEGEARYLAVVLPAGGKDVTAFDIGPAATIEGLIRSASGWWPFGRGGRRAGLRAALLGPLARELTGARQLVIAPDGQLSGVDFGRLLGEQVAVRRVSSGRELLG